MEIAGVVRLETQRQYVGEGWDNGKWELADRPDVEPDVLNGVIAHNHELGVNRVDCRLQVRVLHLDVPGRSQQAVQREAHRVREHR